MKVYVVSSVDNIGAISIHVVSESQESAQKWIEEALEAGLKYFGMSKLVSRFQVNEMILSKEVKNG